MMETTPSGIEIRDCTRCGMKHPVTRRHCINCDSPTPFIDKETGLCLDLPNRPGCLARG
jgi:ribosomal protein S14